MTGEELSTEELTTVTAMKNDGEGAVEDPSLRKIVFVSFLQKNFSVKLIENIFYNNKNVLWKIFL